MVLRNVAAAALAALSLLGAQTVRAEDKCPLEHMPAVSATRIRSTLAANREAIIVALGSSSTEGVQATSLSHTYPARLQDDLNASLPGVHIAVINRGIGGEDAVEEMARLDRDVIAVQPSMVIWQVGANGAMGRGDPVVFRKLVSAGIERMQKLGIDIVLMDNQRSPAVLAAPHHELFDRILAELADTYHVSLFSRGAMMDDWASSGSPYGKFLAGDGVHMNDYGYRCTADALAETIETGLGATSVALLKQNRPPIGVQVTAAK